MDHIINGQYSSINMIVTLSSINGRAHRMNGLISCRINNSLVPLGA